MYISVDEHKWNILKIYINAELYEIIIDAWALFKYKR